MPSLIRRVWIPHFHIASTLSSRALHTYWMQSSKAGLARSISVFMYLKGGVSMCLKSGVFPRGMESLGTYANHVSEKSKSEERDLEREIALCFSASRFHSCAEGRDLRWKSPPNLQSSRDPNLP